MVAKAWVDPEFKRALLADASQATGTLKLANPAGDHLVAVENTPTQHNMVVCTLCSCYPWDMLGLPPVWYKSAPYRSRAVKDPRGVLADFGITLPPATAIRVWDSTAETRFIVIPMRPPGTEGWTEEQLAQLVTRDSMIGTGLAKNPARSPDGRHPRPRRDGRLRQGRAEPDEPVFHAPWEGRVMAMQRAMMFAGGWNIDMLRYAQERLPPRVYLGVSYYERWALATESSVVERGCGTADELAAGHALRPGKPLPRKLTAAMVAGGIIRGGYARPRRGPRVSRPAIACARRTFIRRRTRGCHVSARPRRHRRAPARLPRVSGYRGDRPGEDPQWLYTVRFDGRNCGVRIRIRR